MKKDLVVMATRSEQKEGKDRKPATYVRFRARVDSADVSFHELREFSQTHNIILKFGKKATEQEQNTFISKLRSKGIILPILTKGK